MNRFNLTRFLETLIGLCAAIEDDAQRTIRALAQIETLDPSLHEPVTRAAIGKGLVDPALIA